MIYIKCRICIRTNLLRFYLSGRNSLRIGLGHEFVLIRLWPWQCDIFWPSGLIFHRRMWAVYDLQWFYMNDSVEIIHLNVMQVEIIQINLTLDLTFSELLCLIAYLLRWLRVIMTSSSNNGWNWVKDEMEIPSWNWTMVRLSRRPSHGPRGFELVWNSGRLLVCVRFRLGWVDIGEPNFGLGRG